VTRHFTVRLTFLDTFQKNSTDVTLERNRRRGCHSSLFVSLVDVVLVAWCLYLLILFLLRGGGGGLNTHSSDFTRKKNNNAKFFLDKIIIFTTVSLLCRVCLFLSNVPNTKKKKTRQKKIHSLPSAIAREQRF
tara:strand:- start:726 stop:1124 length:399 start_codon:yes stop_codon:yes gene_type:complete